MEENDSHHDITLRSYQRFLLNTCMEKNAIVFLPTGAGKTMIAVHAIQQLGLAHDRRPTCEAVHSSDSEKCTKRCSIKNGGKRTVFLVPTKVLVQQQAQSVRDAIPYKVSEYTGEMGIDFWSKARWLNEMEINDVLVMPYGVLQNLFTQNVVSVDMLALLIIDECHNGVQDHPIRQVMKVIQSAEERMRPRVIGLTATLLNRTVKNEDLQHELPSLENTMLGRIATCLELKEVLQHSADPEVLYYWYDQWQNNIVDNIEIMEEKCLEIIKRVDIVEENEVTLRIPDNYIKPPADTSTKFIKRTFEDLNFLLNELGIYGGAIAVLYHHVLLEQKRLLSPTKIKTSMYGFVISCLHQIRSYLMDLMDHNWDSTDKIQQFCSPKVNALLDILRKDTTGNATIIFAQRRSTAVVLAQILKKVTSDSKNCLNHIKSSFMVGGRSNPWRGNLEASLQSKWDRQTFQRFVAKELNTIVATSVLEEGMDFQSCTKAIKFDMNSFHYRSFVQGKGRVRDRSGQYCILAPRGSSQKVSSMVQGFLGIEKTLYALLIGKINDDEPDLDSSLLNDTVQPYKVPSTGAHVTGITAIGLVAKYCGMLPQDLFSQLLPTYFIQKSKGKKRCAVQLPIVSPICDLIEGPFMETAKLAKRAAFVKTVKALHAAGELDDYLKPVQVAPDSEDLKWLFPHYVIEPKNANFIPGTKKRRQLYPIQFPDCLSSCLVRPGASPYYLHILNLMPNYTPPAFNRRIVVHRLTGSERTYAILSSKPMENICEFPLYSSTGELRVTISSVTFHKPLTKKQLEQISHFHLKLFTVIVEAEKDFLAMANEEKGGAYHLVPVIKDRGEWQIDWPVVLDVTRLTSEVCDSPPSYDVKSFQSITVVSPKYRASDDKYIITEVCETLNPMSPFPENTHDSYCAYYLEKYDEVIKDKTQPLLEVKRLPSIRSNFLKPRSIKIGGVRSRRKTLADGDELDEILVGELCALYRYPADLWLKAMFLPAALHRIHQLLMAVQLYRAIQQGLGMSYRRDWAPLTPVLKPASSPSTELQAFPPREKSSQPTLSRPSSVKKAETKVLLDKKGCGWNEADEPVNIWEKLDIIAECDIKYYCEFTNKRMMSAKVAEPSGSDSSHFIAYPRPKSIIPLKIFKAKGSPDGPKIEDVLAAVTHKSANDFFDLERLEILGDSFLKLAASQFLYKEFPKKNEGDLTNIKGKLVSNRNLLYCGLAKQLSAIIQAQEFLAESEWVPPLMEVPTEICELMKIRRKDPSVLFFMYVPPDERMPGQLSKSTMQTMVDALEFGDDVNEQDMMARSFVFLGQKLLPDKYISDSVEALLGCYVLDGGLNLGVRFLEWMGVIAWQRTDTDVTAIWKEPAVSPSVAPVGEIESHLNKVLYHELENILHYKFKNPAFLLQALTHPTYPLHRVTDCYQRLEFLGDAILDFLITSFIYQEAPQLDPGDITLLRSALVNNTTFGCLSVRHQFHRYLLTMCPPLDDAISKFIEFQSNRDHIVDEAVMILLEENDCKNVEARVKTGIAEAVDVPKALGDVFESLAGAIFLDSGNSLEAVWNVFYPLMHKELHMFMADIPRNSIQRVHEMGSVNVKTEMVGGARVVHARVELCVPGVSGVFSAHGFGNSTFEAKRSAAKMVIRRYELHEMESSSFDLRN